MREVQRYYYDTNGKKIEYDTKDIHSPVLHDEIAEDVINKNPDFKKEYEQIREKGVISESVFLVMKGYIYVGGISESKMSAMFSSISLNENTKKIITSMNESGYYIYDIIRDELEEEQQKQIKSWYKNGMSRSEIINKVMTDMLTILAPTKAEEVKKDNKKDFER